MMLAMSSMYPEEVVQQVNQRLDIRRLMQLIDYKFDKYQDSAKTVKCFCPIHCEGLFRNLIIDKEQCTFRCLYTQCEGSKGGNLVELFATARKVSFDEALRTIVESQDLSIQLPIDPAYLENLHKEAAARLEEDNLEAAEQLYRELLIAEPENEAVARALLDIYTRQENAVKRTEILARLVRSKIDSGNHLEVAEEIRAWAEAAPEDVETHMALADLTLTEGDAESAVMEYMAAADALESAERYDDAVKAYNRVEQVSRDHQLDLIDAIPHIVRVYSQAGRASEAIVYLQGKSSELLQAGEPDRALEMVASAIELDTEDLQLRQQFLEAASRTRPRPEYAKLIFETADLFAAREDHETAIRALQNYVDTAPEDEPALQRLVDMYYTHGQPAEAAAIEARLARMAFSAGDEEGARERLQNILQWQPEHVDALAAFADIEASTGNAEAARDARRRQAKALTGQRQFSRALEVLDSLLEQEPGSAVLLEQRASALEAGYRAGVKDYEQPARDALLKLAGLSEETTSGQRSLGFLERAAAIGTADPDLLFRLASTQLRAGNRSSARDHVILACEALASGDGIQDAVREAARFADVMPMEADLIRYLAELYIRQGNKVAAVARLRRLGNDLIGAGRQAEANEVLEQATTLEPEDPKTLLSQAEAHLKAGDKKLYCDTLLRLAALHEGQGELEQAIKVLERLLSESDEAATAATRLVQLHERVNRHDDAQKWRLKLASVYRGARDHDREARVLRDAAARDSEDEQILAMLSACEFSRRDVPAGVQVARRLAAQQQRQGRLEDAAMTLRRALERAPEHLELQRDLFQVVRQTGPPAEVVRVGQQLSQMLADSRLLAEAVSVYSQVIESQPGSLELRMAQVAFLEKIERQADAADQRLQVAELQKQAELFEDARATLLKNLESDPQHVRTRQALAELYRTLGEDDKAEEQLAALAQSFVEEGEGGRALATLVQLTRNNPANTEARRQLIKAYRTQGLQMDAVRELHQLADYLRRQNSESEALAAEREAAEILPKDLEARERLIDSLLKSGRTEQATDEMELVAAAYIEQGKMDQATEVLDRLLKLEPDKLNGRRLRAELFSSIGEHEKALEEFRQLAVLAASAARSQASSGARVTTGGDSAIYGLELVKDYDFDRFVVGTNNNFAYATALAVARSPATAYNPLFLYADVGLGKTHLCNAIANHILTHDPKARVLYTNSEDFTGELIEAIQNNAIQGFRNRYRSVDLLIVDDVQFLAGKERAQEEFFHIFNALFQAKKQIVITSDRPPSEISHLEGRLRSRFGAGVIVDIASPDLETRIAILNREIELQNLGLDGQIARLVAEHINTNVRELKGALNQVVAMRDIRGQDLNDENLHKMLETYYAAPAPEAS